MRISRLSGLVLSLAIAVGSACSYNSQQTEKADAGTVKAATPKESDNSAGGPEKQAKLDIISHLPDVVEKALPGVVGLSTKRVVDSRPHQFPFGNNPFFDDSPFGRRMPDQREQQGMGSGVIVDKDGTILTNNHVVEGADEIRVSFSDRRDELNAKIVGTDKATDIAVLKLENPPEDLKPVPIGDSDKIRLGEPVVAIGNPFGLSSSVTYGIVSAKGRANVGLADYEDFIQTDAAINPGNSGGALLNMEGELIGINTAILSRSGGYQGIGFAIPSKMAQSVMQKLLTTGEVRRGHLGIYIQTLSSELAEAFNLPKDTKGVVVSRVQEDSPAQRSGLQQGDVITKFEGEEVETANDLRNVVAQQSPGSRVDVTVVREGEEKTIEVELGSLGGGTDGKLEFERQGMLQGLVLGSIDSEAREQFDIPEGIEHGLVVSNIKRGSPAARTGLRPGDVILEVNRNKVRSIDQFQEAYDRAERRVLLLIYRDGSTLFLAIPKR